MYATLSARPESSYFDIDSTQGWQSTGLYVQQGESIIIEYITGKWSPCAPPKYACPFVTGSGTSDPLNYPQNLLMGCPHLAVIAKIGNSEPFCVSSHFGGSVSSSGILYLRANDLQTSDNGGSVRVRIKLP
jgi:hypothetical protein